MRIFSSFLQREVLVNSSSDINQVVMDKLDLKTLLTEKELRTRNIWLIIFTIFLVLQIFSITFQVFKIASGSVPRMEAVEIVIGALCSLGLTYLYYHLTYKHHRVFMLTESISDFLTRSA